MLIAKKDFSASFLQLAAVFQQPIFAGQKILGWSVLSYLADNSAIWQQCPFSNFTTIFPSQSFSLN
jgi:hypothetical protein